MQSERKGPRSGNPLMLASVGVSVVLGIIVGELVGFENFGTWHFVSITGRGPLADMFLIITALLIVFSAIGMAAVMRPSILIILGAVLVLAALGGPSLISYISPDTKIDIQTRNSFLFLAVLEFVGGAFLSAGLLDIFRRRKSQSSVTAGKLDKNISPKHK